MCVDWRPSCSRNTPGQWRHSFSVGPPLTGEGPAPYEVPVNPNPIEMEEADPRARPAFGLDVDSPGATRICVLLVRGTLTFQSFRRLPSQVETGHTCDVYNGQLVHPCRVNLFEKSCPRLWTTQCLHLVHSITSNWIMIKNCLPCVCLGCLSSSRGTKGGTRLCYVCVSRWIVDL